MPRHLRLPAAIAAGILGILLAGCSETVSLPPAADANNPLCAEVSVRLPGHVDGMPRRWTDAQATGAWGEPGEPTSVILACGVKPPGPTTDPCITVGGVDWVIDESEAPRYRVTTYGRTPAVQVMIEGDSASSRTVLEAFSPLVRPLPATAGCTPAPTQG